MLMISLEDGRAQQDWNMKSLLNTIVYGAWSFSLEVLLVT